MLVNTTMLGKRKTSEIPSNIISISLNNKPINYIIPPPHKRPRVILEIK